MKRYRTAIGMMIGLTSLLGLCTFLAIMLSAQEGGRSLMTIRDNVRPATDRLPTRLPGYVGQDPKTDAEIKKAILDYWHYKLSDKETHPTSVKIIRKGKSKDFNLFEYPQIGWRPYTQTGPESLAVVAQCSAGLRVGSLPFETQSCLYLFDKGEVRYRDTEFQYRPNR